MFGDDDEFGFEERESLDTALNEVYPLKGMKLFYHFDFGDSWMFTIKKGRKKKHVEKGVTPRSADPPRFSTAISHD